MTKHTNDILLFISSCKSKNLDIKYIFTLSINMLIYGLDEYDYILNNTLENYISKLFVKIAKANEPFGKLELFLIKCKLLKIKPDNSILLICEQAASLKLISLIIKLSKNIKFYKELENHFSFLFNPNFITIMEMEIELDKNILKYETNNVISCTYFNFLKN